MRRTLSADMVAGPGALDAEAIAQVADEAWPLVRDADELHDALLTLVVLPPTPEWEDYFAELSQAGRATTLQVPIEFPQSPESPEHTPAPEPTGPPEQSRARTGAVEPTDDLEPTGDASDAAVTTSFWTAAERLALVSRSRPESPYPSDPTVTPHSRLAGSLRRRDLAWLARLQRAGNRR